MQINLIFRCLDSGFISHYAYANIPHNPPIWTHLFSSISDNGYLTYINELN